MVDCGKRLVEVDEVLNHLTKEDLIKIPKDIRAKIIKNKDKEYIWKYDESKKLKDQDLSRDTIALLSYLNMKYLLNDEQKKLLEKSHQLNQRLQEREKAKEQNDEEIFKKMLEEEKTEEGKALIEVEKKGFVAKMLEKIKNFFKKNKNV